MKRADIIRPNEYNRLDKKLNKRIYLLSRRVVSRLGMPIMDDMGGSIGVLKRQILWTIHS